MHRSEIQIRDPFILKDGGKYYMFGSTDKDIWRDAPGVGFDAYVSGDLENWEGPFEAFRPADGFWGTHNFWAPEVYLHEEAYYMFATFISKTTKRGTAILKADNPLGPYQTWSDGAVTPADWMCLDGTFFLDDEKQPWMVFCHEWVQIGDGTVCAVKLSADLKKAVSEPHELFKSSDASWSCTAHSPSNQITGYVTDGCNFYRMKNGKLLMLWSCIGTEGYCIGYAISENGSLQGPWKQSGEPLFKKDGGHGMIFTAYDDRLLLAIHRPNKTPDERAHFFELTEKENGIQLKSGRPIEQ